jgi:hypothetical protein
MNFLLLPVQGNRKPEAPLWPSGLLQVLRHFVHLNSKELYLKAYYGK